MTVVCQDAAYGRLKAHLIKSTGLAFYSDRDTKLAELIGQRLTDLHLRDCSSYQAFLGGSARGKAEMDVLVEQLTIGETYFFRDPEQFAAIRDVILPDILQRNRRSKQLRIWSAGCATGTEPYSLAILMKRELADQIAGWQIKIYATDLNRNYLARAEEGTFRAWALRCTSDQVKRQCFSKEGLAWTIHPRYKEWISFRQMNLVDNEFRPPFGADAGFDLILCRNVMIYFAPEVNHRLLGRFHRALGNDGWLVNGSSENILEDYTDFRRVNAAGTKLYQKLGRPPEPVAAVTKQTTPSRGAAFDWLPAIPSVAVATSPIDMDGLRKLADRGDWKSAADYGQRLLARNPLNPKIHFYLALIFESLGVAEEAERSFRQAIYLDRAFALAHYHLGLALKRDRQMLAAARSFGNVLTVLSGMPDQALVTDGSGVTVARLKELARMHLTTSSES